MRKKTLIFQGRVTKNETGTVKVNMQNREQFAQLVFEMFGEEAEGNILMTITQNHKYEDNTKMLTWFHGVFLPFVAAELTKTTGQTWEPETLKDELKAQFLFLNAAGGVPSLSELCREELKTFIEESKQFAVEFANVKFET